VNVRISLSLTLITYAVRRLDVYSKTGLARLFVLICQATTFTADGIFEGVHVLRVKQMKLKACCGCRLWLVLRQSKHSSRDNVSQLFHMFALGSSRAGLVQKDDFYHCLTV
jgi:hypothetical protein